MKNNFVCMLIGLLLASCTKDKTTTPNSNITHSPNLLALGYKPGQPIDASIWHIYDLNHDDNAQKKYIRVQFYSDDSARILEGPKPIDSIAAGWPADIKIVRWSAGSQYIVNDREFIGINGGNFTRENYNASNPQHAWLSRHRETTSAVSLPNGELYWNGVSTNYRLFYFSYKSVSLFFSPGGYQLVPLSSPVVFGQAANAYDWTNVTHFMYVGGAFNSYFFFDFKNWRYWKINQSNGVANDFVGHPVKSLDRFLKWPEGWGKNKVT
jgi:hypothetical protein